MQKFFADTWFFIALLDRADGHHRRASRLASTIPPRNLVTHDGVLTEMLATFAEDGARARQTAVDAVGRTLRASVVIPADRELFMAALNRYAARPDKEWSHVDCMSMVLMEHQGIRHVLTNDHHFAQAGFTVVNE